MMSETVGAKIARTIVWSRINAPKHVCGNPWERLHEKFEVQAYVPFTADEVERISTKGTLADMCGGFYQAAKASTDKIHRKNLRLLYSIEQAMVIHEKGVGSQYPTEAYQECIDILVELGLFDLEAFEARQTDNVELVAQACDEIYNDLLPVEVEQVAATLSI